MTQTRTFLLIAWLLVAFLLWDAWQKDYGTSRAVPPPAAVAIVDPSIPTPIGEASVPKVPTVQGGEAASELPEGTGSAASGVVLV